MLKHITYVKVTEVDENTLRFRNLEELTLTGNYIRRVNSHHLPRTLKVCLLSLDPVTCWK